MDWQRVPQAWNTSSDNYSDTSDNFAFTQFFHLPLFLIDEMVRRNVIRHMISATHFLEPCLKTLLIRSLKSRINAHSVINMIWADTQAGSSLGGWQGRKPNQTIKCYVFSIKKHLLTGREFTTNIPTEGIPWRLESAEVRFWPGFYSNPAVEFTAVPIPPVNRKKPLFVRNPSTPSASRPRRLRTAFLTPILVPHPCFLDQPLLPPHLTWWRAMEDQKENYQTETYGGVHSYRVSQKMWAVGLQVVSSSILHQCTKSLLNFQKYLFYYLTVNCSMQLTILCTCWSLWLTPWFAKYQMRPYIVCHFARQQWNFFKLVHNWGSYIPQYNSIHFGHSVYCVLQL